MKRLSVGVWLVGVALAAAPARADVFAGVEVGAKGVKVVVLELTPADPPDLVVKYSDSTNVGLVAEVAKTGRLDPKMIAAAATAVGKYAIAVRDKYGVPADRVYVVGSSGLFSPIEDKAEMVAANRAALDEHP